MEAAIMKSNKKMSWIFRTFSTRKIDFLRKIWKSLVQCHLDYGSTLWSQVSRKMELRSLEGPLRAYTKRRTEMFKLNYWERLKCFKSSCVQRCRYKILYIWKWCNCYSMSINKWLFYALFSSYFNAYPPLLPSHWLEVPSDQLSYISH